MKATRHQSRLAAVQILYQMDLNNELVPESALKHFNDYYSKEGLADAFAKQLVEGVSAHCKELNEVIENASQNWRLSRMPAVDRAILRLGAFELLHCDDIPSTVTLNEMIELAKQFGSENSASFVNGVLDRLAGELDKPNKAP